MNEYESPKINQVSVSKEDGNSKGLVVVAVAGAYLYVGGVTVLVGETIVAVHMGAVFWPKS